MCDATYLNQRIYDTNQVIYLSSNSEFVFFQRTLQAPTLRILGKPNCRVSMLPAVLNTLIEGLWYSGNSDKSDPATWSGLHEIMQIPQRHIYLHKIIKTFILRLRKPLQFLFNTDDTISRNSRLSMKKDHTPMSHMFDIHNSLNTYFRLGKPLYGFQHAA